MPKTPAGATDSKTGPFVETHTEEELMIERDRGVQDYDDETLIASDGTTYSFDKAPMNTDAPPPRPGYVQRWIRTGIQDTPDPTNLARSERFGWKPRRSDTVGESWRHMASQHGPWAGVIVLHNMVLCERPKEVDDQHRQYLAKRTKHQTRAVVDNLEGMEHADMPMSILMQSRVHKGGRTPVVMKDSDKT